MPVVAPWQAGHGLLRAIATTSWTRWPRRAQRRSWRRYCQPRRRTGTLPLRRCCCRASGQREEAVRSQFDLPDLMQPGAAPVALAAIARSAAEGTLSAEEAVEIGKVIEAYTRATDVVALTHRIEQLEAILVTASAILPHQPSAAIGAAVRRNGTAAG